MIDILFLAHNRLEFTKVSFEALLANTHWDLVDRLYVFDDGSGDGTCEYLEQKIFFLDLSRFKISLIRRTPDNKLGSPVEVMNYYLSISDKKIPYFAKIDNDVIVTPNWLLKCSNVMLARPELDLLGIEPWMSRTPHLIGGKRSPAVEVTGPHEWTEIEHNGSRLGYAPCDSIGGIGLMKREAFRKHQDLRPHSTYGGFTEWQLNHRDLIKGWMLPSLNIFLLDRMPTEPWKSLSEKYIAKGWQRSWSGYSPANPFWNWYER